MAEPSRVERVTLKIKIHHVLDVASAFKTDQVLQQGDSFTAERNSSAQHLQYNTYLCISSATLRHRKYGCSLFLLVWSALSAVLQGFCVSTSIYLNSSTAWMKMESDTDIYRPLRMKPSTHVDAVTIE